MNNVNNLVVSIIGVGNIGFRYYQAILEMECVQKINLIEKEIESLKKKIKINSTNKEITFNNELSADLLKSDLIIISTTSSQRFDICKKLRDLGYYGNLILEKFLFPDANTLSKSEIFFDSYPSKIYVNQWMRKTNLRKMLYSHKPAEIEIVSDNLGLLCNSVHYIDLICERYKSYNFSIDLDLSYVKDVVKSKRDGYMEIFGKLVWRDKSNLITFSLEDKGLEGSNSDVHFKLTNKLESNNYIYSEWERELRNIETGKIDYIPFLSEHAKDSIFSILNCDNPEIPSFKESLEHHKLVFNSLSKLLKKEDYEKLKIT